MFLKAQLSLSLHSLEALASCLNIQAWSALTLAEGNSSPQHYVFII